MVSTLLTDLEENCIYPAHIRVEDGAVQTVHTHCTEAATFAHAALESVGLGEAGYLAGLLHDAGKQTGAYRHYLVDALEGRPVQRGSVNHTFAGVRLVLDVLCEGASKSARLAAQHIAYAIGAHHGLFDAVDPDGINGFDHRRTKPDPTIEEGLRNALTHWDSEELRSRLERAEAEVMAFYKHLPKEERSFLSHLLVRLLLSAVIEGDRRSTAEFENPTRPHSTPATKMLWSDCLKHLEDKLFAFPKETAVQIGRSSFSNRCKDFARKPGGIYRLNMPTGAGKTLSSLRYALAHAEHRDKKHIFFVMPLLAIIDQNASVIREYLGQEDVILEHHSNILATEEGPELDRRELLMENWDAPLVITTLVQFLNTLFSHKTTSIRRMHSLCDSVIIFDEVQTVPPKMLSLFNQAITFLAKGCNATIILCSATQPPLECAQHPIAAPEEMIPYEGALWAPFRRTSIQPTPAMDLEEIAAFASQRLAKVQSLLIICNKKAQSEELFRHLQHEDAACFHLSAAMCMAHRRETLVAMEAAKNHGKVICVSTQIMEAGIDASFGCVIRLQAGMDSVIQAAGRCNRHGESETPAPVYVIRCRGESLTYLKDIERGRTASGAIFAMGLEDYSSEKAIESYYRTYYNEQSKNAQDFYCKHLDATLYDLLGGNSKYQREGIRSPYFINQAFKTACTDFQVFDEDTVDVVVPYGNGAEEIKLLRRDPQYLFKHSAQLKPYTVSLYAHQRKALDEQGALSTAPGGILVLEPNWYDNTLGLQIRREMTFLEV